MSNDYSNLEFCFEATGYAKRNKSYLFRMGLPAGSSGRALGNLRYPELKIEDADPANPPPDLYMVFPDIGQ